MYLFALASAWAAAPTWTELPQLALDSWDESAASGWETRAEAEDRAASRVPLGPTSVRAEAQLGLRDQDQLLVAVDLPLATGARQRRAWHARSDLTEAEAARARWQWVSDVHDAWEAWWTAATLADDLAQYAAESGAELDALQEAVDDGVLAPIALDDLRAEWVQVTDEAAAMAIDAGVALAELEGLVGPLGVASAPEAPSPVGSNPWTTLPPEALPDLAIGSARAAVADAEAAALGAARAPVLSAGPMAARDATGALRPFAWVGVTVPLQAGVSPARRGLRAEAEAARADLAWTRRRAEAALQGEAARWEGLRDRLDVLDEEVIAPLEARRERLEAALDEGLVTADRVVRARREAHEAEHQRIRVLGALLSSEARAATLARIEGGGA